MSDIMNPLAKCQHCEKKYSEGVPLIGESEAEKIARITNKLARHIEDKHPDHWQAAIAVGKTGAVFEALCSFDMPPESWLARFRNGVRHAFSKRYRLFRIDDANIRQMVDKLQLPEEYVERVFALAASMRNVLEEIPPVSQPPNGENQNGTERVSESTPHLH